VGMLTARMADTDQFVSRVGLGGHYKAMEEGSYEERTAYVEAEVCHRTALVERAIAGGVTYFDTTWRNEAEMLSRTLGPLGCRDRVWVNGMVLGAFSGSASLGVSPESYFDRWLDARMAVVPGGHFDSVMINAIEEGFDAAKCRTLIDHLERRRLAGDFRLLGFSTHRPALARELLDQYHELRIAMVPHNYRNRAFREAFEGYGGDAALIAMKPLVWAEYGIAFCCTNRLPAFEAVFGFAPVHDIAARALRFALRHPAVTTVVSASNELDEVDSLLAGGELADDPGEEAPTDDALLARYNALQDDAHGLAVFLGALLCDNLRANFFACANISRLVHTPMPQFRLNEPGERSGIIAFAKGLLPKLAEAGYGAYLTGIEL
jgi:predicted aldo/keto reductase-like oxidoreductase